MFFSYYNFICQVIYICITFIYKIIILFLQFQFFVGWWFIIDAHAKYPNEMAKAYHVCGIFGTISLFM